MMVRLFFLVLTVGLLVACHDVKKQQQLEDVAALLSEMDSMQRVYNTHYTDTLPALLDRVRDVEREIKRGYGNDTIDLDMGRKLEAYRFISRNIGPVQELGSEYSERAAEERTDLLQLQKDIRAGSGDRSRYDNYIRLEKNKVTQLRVMLGDWFDTQQQCLANYRDYHVEMQAYALRLRSGKPIHSI